MRRSKGPGCLSTIFIMILLLFAAINIFDFPSDGSTPRLKSSSSSSSSASRSTPKQSTSEANSAPGLKGSNAYDIIGSMRDMGYTLERQSASAGFMWFFSDQSDGVYISLDITCNKNYQICSASFTMTHGDNGFLYFGSTLPYSAADQALTAELIKSDVEKSITIGDAVWTIHPLPYGKWLHVAHVDYEEWCGESIFSSANNS